MTKKLGRALNKRVLLGAIIGVLMIALAAGAYYFYTQNQKQQTEKAAEQKKVVATERKKLDDTAFRGDRDLAAEYTAKVQEGQLDEAYQVYELAAQKTTDTSVKIALYEQAVTIAYRADQSEYAIKYAIKASDLANTYRASVNVADLYGLSKDYDNQKKYLQKALDQIEALPKDSVEYTTTKAYYQDRLSKVGAS